MIFFLQRSKNIKNSNDNFVKKKRGDILDRNGNVLARTISSYDLYFDKKNMLNFDKNAEKIVKIIFENRITKDQFIKKILDFNGDSVLVKRNISYYKIRELKENGVINSYFKESQKRAYPLSKAVSHIIGAVDFDEKGILGVEKFLNSELEKGNSVQLSIDANIQKLLWDSLNIIYEKYKPKNVFGIISDLHTGEIIAGASLPDFNPNKITNINETFDANISGRYEFGSTMKILLYAASLEYGLSKKKKYNVKDSVNLDTYKINDVSKNLSSVDLEDMVKFSSNRGAILIMQDIGLQNYKNFLSQFDFDKSINLDALQTETGNMKDIQNWNTIRTLTSGYGYGFSITPMHFVYAANVLVNGGRAVDLTLLKRDSYWDNLIESKRIVSEETSIDVRRVLFETIEHGSGNHAKSEYYSLGGKSGTAMKVVNGKYSKDKNLVNFYTILSAKNPRYSIFIAADIPSINAYNAFGSSVIAPVIPDLVKKIGPILKIKPDR